VWMGHGSKRVRCVSETDGSTLWTTTIGGDTLTQLLLFNNVLYAGSFGYAFVALNPFSGTVMYSLSMAVRDGFAFDGSQYIFVGITYGVSAVDLSTGTVAWTYSQAGDYTLSGPMYTAGVVAIVLGGSSPKTYGLDATTGALLWTSNAWAQNQGPAYNGVFTLCSTPAVLIGISATTGSTLWTGGACNLFGLTSAGSTLYNLVYSPSQTLSAVDIATGTILYTLALPVCGPSCIDLYGPVVANGFVYYATQRKDFQVNVSAVQLP